MSNDFSRYVLRKPRHPAAAPAAVRLTVASRAGEPEGALTAELLDLSRDGFRLRTPVALAIGEHLSLSLLEAPAQASLVLEGSVRWHEQQPDGWWLLGCQTDRRVDWETLGELFLHNILATEPGPAGGGN